MCPSVVLFDLRISGSAVVPQTTPLTVIAEPPSEVITPPETALVASSAEIATVVRVGAVARVVNEISFPYAVPALFVAYARTWYVVPADNPVKLPVKVPVGVPLVVFESAIVGSSSQTPADTTGCYYRTSIRSNTSTGNSSCLSDCRSCSCCKSRQLLSGL